MKIKAREFEKAFERGEDVSRYLDVSNARRPDLEKKAPATQLRAGPTR